MFKIVNKARYELLEKMVERQDNYIENIKLNNKKIDELKEKTNKILEELKIKEDKRRKLASKVGGLQASLNNQKEKNSIILENLELKTLEADLKNKEILMLRNKDKKNKNIEDYKNYFEGRKEILKRMKEVNKIEYRDKKKKN